MIDVRSDAEKLKDTRAETARIMANRERHGSPYDRGSADAYYQRGRNPHYYKGDTYQSERVEAKDMNVYQIREYDLGYGDSPCGTKDWGV